jgi:hypothetical protein
MIKKTLIGAALLSAFATTQAQTLNAGHNYVVEDTGTYSADSSYMNWGFVAGFYKSFGVFDFNGSALGNVSSVTSATLTVQESDYASTSSVPVDLTVWAVTDNVTSLAAGQTGVENNDSVVGGYTNQLGTATQLGTFIFNPNGLVNGGSITNQQDVINLTTGLSSLTSLINSSNHVIRLLVTSNETGEVTWAGAGSSSAYVPSLSLQTTAAPEPASFAALGLGIIGLVARKRRK